MVKYFRPQVCIIKTSKNRKYKAYAAETKKITLKILSAFWKLRSKVAKRDLWICGWPQLWLRLEFLCTKVLSYSSPMTTCWQPILFVSTTKLQIKMICISKYSQRLMTSTQLNCFGSTNKNTLMQIAINKSILVLEKEVSVTLSTSITEESQLK